MNFTGKVALVTGAANGIGLASAMGFDTGVYLVVFGGVMLILSMMGTVKPSRTRSARHGEIDIHRRSARTGEMH